MDCYYYQVLRIDGDYAVLMRSDSEMETEKLVARALLPDEIEEGSQLKYENFEYSFV